MPLDSHSYLVAQGWSGKGTGLREGAISRPITISQKKTLAGVGKDRDEAFPFWDHLFAAAAKAVKIRISKDEDDDESSLVSLKRTETGILSNRRPIVGTPVATSSGSSTPDDIIRPRLSLMATAKREVAKQGLYSRFFRGPVVGPDVIPPDEQSVESPSIASPMIAIKSELVHAERRRNSPDIGTKAERRERKRLKRERREMRKEKESESRCLTADDNMLQFKLEKEARREQRRAKRESKVSDGKIDVLKGEKKGESEEDGEKGKVQRKKKRKRSSDSD